MTGTPLLLVEDDPRIAAFLQRGLGAEGYVVDVARSGESGLVQARKQAFALIVLDFMLPDMTGLEVCKALRDEGCPSRVLMLTVRSGVQDRIAGLRSGADDYLVKPFAFDELVARIEALMRRGTEVSATKSILRIEDLSLDLNTKVLHRRGAPIDLTPKEFTLLAYLMANADRVVSRAQLLSNVWGVNFDPQTKVVEVYIQYLRRKIDVADRPSFVQTVRGFGYTIRTDPARALPPP